MLGRQSKGEPSRFDHRHAVSIIGIDGTWRRSCILLDASAGGAKLEVEGSIAPLTAQEFFLVLSASGLAFRPCNLIWIDGAHIGVQFVTGNARGKTSPEKRLVVERVRIER